MMIRVLGSGCAKCTQLADRTRAALERLAVAATVVDEHDPVEIAACGVMRTPALEVDGEIVVAGRVPSVDQLAELITSRVGYAGPPS